MKTKRTASMALFVFLSVYALSGAVHASNLLSRESGKDPVVLVHGYAGSVLGQLSVEGYWVYYTTRFAIDGYDAYKIALPDAALADVRVSAEKLRGFVADVLARTGKSKVDIVCHSEGGLVARYYIQNLSGAAYVDGLVTIATPHRGTSVASIGPGTSARQMEVFNDFLRELNSTNTFPGSVDYTAIHSNQDEMVFPPQNGFWEGAVNVNFNLLGHAGIMLNESVYQAVRGAISTDIGGSHRAIPIEIQNPKMTTGSPNVTLKINAFNHNYTGGDMRQMKVSSYPFMNGANWESVASAKSWQLMPGDGLKPVYVQFRESGNWLFPKESPVYVDYIFLDQTAPSGSVNVVPDTTLDRSVAVSLSADDNSDNFKTFKIWNALIAFGIEDLGVKEMMVSANASFAGAAWQPYAKGVTLDLGAGTGAKTVYAKFRDGAGNESPVYSDSVTVIDPVADGLTMVDETARTPVVLVHGYGGSIVGDVSTYVNWVYIYEKLRADGFDVSRISLGLGALQDIRISADELKSFVSGVLARTASPKVDIVCHSEGGLVARYYIQNLGGAPFVNDLVTISTPHRGSTTTVIGPGEAARQMEVASDFLMQLNSGDTTPGDVEYTALFSNGDEIVVPGKNGFMDGAVNVNWNLFGHAGILFAPEPYAVVRAALAKRYIKTSGTPPVRIDAPGMVTNAGSLQARFVPYNHYAPSTKQDAMMVSVSPTFGGAAWEPISESKSIDISREKDGMIGVHVKYRGADGWESPSYVDYIMLDRTPPTAKTAIASVDEENNIVALNISVSDNTDKYGKFAWTNLLEAYGVTGIGAADMMFSEAADFKGAAWEPIAGAKSIQLSSGKGQKIVYAKFRDKAGNESASAAIEVYLFDGVNGYMAMEENKNPVVFVHGYMGSIVGDVSAYLNWVYFYEKLKAEGFDVNRIAISDAAMGDIKVSAEELARFVQDVRARTGADRVDIVCHSEGGLVARYFIQKLGGASLTDDLITISTPHRGTSTSTIGPGEAARQMEIASDFLQNLNKGDTTPGNVDYTAIFTNDDITVTPAQNAFFDGAVNINTNFWNHATILFNDEVYLYVKSALTLDVGHRPEQLPVLIVNDGMVTASPQTALSINYYNHNDPVSAPSQMMISNHRLFHGASWQPISNSVSWTLDADDGLKGVYVKFKSEKGVESPAYVAYIVLDRTPPAAVALVLPGPTAADQSSVVISATDNTDTYARLTLAHLLESYGITGIGVQEMMISDKSDFAGASWVPFAEKTAWPAAETVYVKLRDKAGNESQTITAAASVQEITETLSVPQSVSALLDLDAGWTLVYLPSNLPDDIRNTLISITQRDARQAFDIKDRVFRNLNDAWKSQGGAAFWLNLPAPLQRDLSFTLGESAAAKQLVLDPGWNVIGLPGFLAVAADDLRILSGADTLNLDLAAQQGLVMNTLLEFNNEQYMRVDTLQPFRAYLIRAYRSCVLELP